MITQIHIQCLIAGLLGIIFHQLMKVSSLRKRSIAANRPFSVSEYLKDDILSIASSVLTLVIAIFVLDELVKFKPTIMEYIKFFFASIGYMGSSVLQIVFSNTEKKILAIVDEKTNKADNIEKG